MGMNLFGPAARAAAVAANAQRLSRKLGTPGDGGFTFDPNTGQDPQQGYAVAQHGSEDITPGVAPPEKIQQYARANDANLATGDKVFGGWHPHHSDPTNPRKESVLDVSQVYPTEREANAAAVRHAQDEFMDLSFSQIERPDGTMAGPFYKTDYPAWTDQGEQRELAEGMHRLATDQAMDGSGRRRFPGS